jgi:hypothetical protein
VIISTSSHCCLGGVFVFYVDDYEFWGLKLNPSIPGFISPHF